MNVLLVGIRGRFTGKGDRGGGLDGCCSTRRRKTEPAEVEIPSPIALDPARHHHFVATNAPEAVLATAGAGRKREPDNTQDENDQANPHESLAPLSEEIGRAHV